jgi:anion-transporting  ArsA/GET3 family ATPase
MKFGNEKQHIVFVTGKGGVGKSALAAAMAENCAKQGKKTLLVELGEHSYYQHVYGQPISYEPREISPHFYVALWSGETCLREYVFHLIRVKKIVDLFFENKIMRTFIRAAPALKELAILGKITSGIRQWGPPLEFDQIVIDCFSSGHFLALLRAPKGMADLISAGPMGEQSRSIDEVLRRTDLCEFKIVTIPEELPVSESQELYRELFAEMGQSSEIICNRIYTPETNLYDLKQKAEKKGDRAELQFVTFLEKTIGAQDINLSNLASTHPHFSRRPFIFSSDGREVIRQLQVEGEGHARPV